MSSMSSCVRSARDSSRPENSSFIPNGMCLWNRTDTSWLSRLLLAYQMYLRGWHGVAWEPDQIYYEQVHINVKSFRQLRRRLTINGFEATVTYDENARPAFLDPWRSSNMLVVAHRI